MSSEGFAYLNEAVASPADEASKSLLQGLHPSTGEPLVAAVSHIASVLDREGKDLDSYYDLGVLMGNKAESIEYYERALEMDPDHTNAEAARARLEELK